MNQRETERKIRQAYDDIVDRRAGSDRSKRLTGYEQAVRQRSRFDSCGRILTSPYGHEVSHWCRRPVCPTCATHWGRKLGRGLVAACPDAVAEDYRMFTAIVAITPTPDEAFYVFRNLRRPLANAVDYRRRAPGIDRAGWHAFGLVGALELDQFEAKDFSRLGHRKRAQYRMLGFDPRSAYGPQWVTTIHGLVHVGTLGNDAMTRLLSDLVPIVHLQTLDVDKNLIANAEDIMGYSAKVGLTTTLTDGDVIPWSRDVIVEYIAATMRCSHGRQGFKLSIRPFRLSKPKNKQMYKSVHLEPMPVLF